MLSRKACGRAARADKATVRHLLALGAGAIPATAAFVVVRNRFDLEDEEFLTAVSVACAVAALVSASLAILLRTRVHRSLESARSFSFHCFSSLG